MEATFGFLFESGRINRVYLQKLQDKSLPGLETVLGQVTAQVFSNTLPGGLKDEIKLMTEAKYVDHLIKLSKDQNASQTVRAITRMHLEELAAKKAESGVLKAHRAYLQAKIEAFLELPEELTAQQSLTIPDGAPIGMEEMSCDFDY